MARLALLLIVTIAAAALGGYAFLRQSLPDIEGNIPTPGLAASVEVLRDGFGVPHLFAGSERDAHFALGFAHAQDRLWQMEMNRRVAAGRLAEVLGERALDTDRFMRTLGLRRAAEANLAHLEAETRAHVEAYAAGVNAFLATRAVLPPEFWLLRVRPEPWTPVDSLSLIKLMALDLDGNWRSELLRLGLARRLPMARVHEFLPPYPGEAPVPLPELAWNQRLGPDPEVPSFDALMAGGGGGASNSWVVAQGAGGAPLLANDPHLGLTAPSVWYLAHLEAPGLSVIGATLPGLPGVVLGRNARIAWGFTNTGADVQDLFLERLLPDGRYDTPEGPRAFTVIEERIGVRGAADELLRVRLSRHGPVISDVSPSAHRLAPPGFVVALAWTALEPHDRTLEGALALGRARGWSEFEAALERIGSPAQTVTYADAEGNIGFIAAGRVPLRSPQNDLKGLVPAPGWLARYDWQGFVPFAELPRDLNPPGGRLVTANHRIVAPGYRHHITTEWQPPYRADRIEALLAQGAPYDTARFARIQLDVVSLAVRALLPHLLATAPASEAAAQALDLLRAWDGTMAAERPEPLIVTAWWRELARALYADELGELFPQAWQPRPQFTESVLRGAHPQWCDDVRTERVETCAEVLGASLEEALAGLRARYGPRMAEWRWGEAHAAEHRHRPLSRHRWLARLADIRVPTPGDAYTVNAGRSDFADAAAPFANRHAASYRAIYDLAAPEASLFIHSTGQSGNPLSPHYRAFAAPWARGEYVPMLTDRARLDAAGARGLLLTPQK